ncbi:hypothetical protein V6N11_033931 [Hibiscus sabdariffa]|uniref:DRBM domain-containing protein n=1 Tax=Hibiscus sabdariffa TaxID=183260 RepID=A0ABR2S0X1_9ROSI
MLKISWYSYQPYICHDCVTDREPITEVAAIQAAQEAIHMILGLSNPSRLARPLENARGPSLATYGKVNSSMEYLHNPTIHGNDPLIHGMCLFIFGMYQFT